MRKSLACLELILAFSLAGPVVAADVRFAPPVPVLNYPVHLREGTQLGGPVTNVDPVNKTIQIKDADGIIQTIAVRGNILLLKDGQPIDLFNVRLGDVITVTSVNPGS
jgi:hypothetical protein